MRVEHPVAIYHVMNRRDQREAVLGAEEGRQRFLATLGGLPQDRVACSYLPSCPGERFVTWKTWGGPHTCPWVSMTPGGGPGREFGVVYLLMGSRREVASHCAP